MLTFQWSTLHSNFYGLCMRVAQLKKKIKPCAPVLYPEVLLMVALLMHVWAIQWNLLKHILKLPKVDAVPFSHMDVCYRFLSGRSTCQWWFYPL